MLFRSFDVARASVNIAGAGGPGGGDGGGQALAALPADTALLLVAAWLIGSLLVAVVFTERAEITG